MRDSDRHVCSFQYPVFVTLGDIAYLAMPFTLYHLGPALLLGLLFRRRLDLPTFLVANVVVDLEAMGGLGEVSRVYEAG